MRKKESFYFNYDVSREELPATLDVVKIDGRWAQVFSFVAGKSGSISFYWLDDPAKKPSSIKPADFEIIKYPMNTLIINIKDEFTEQEFNNLHEARGNPPELKKFIKVFGELNSKSGTGL